MSTMEELIKRYFYKNEISIFSIGEIDNVSKLSKGLSAYLKRNYEGTRELGGSKKTKTRKEKR